MLLEEYNLLIHNIETYLNYPYKRCELAYKVILQIGSAKLLSYNDFDDTQATILFVPSIINKHYILDLIPERSLIKFLIENKINIFVLAWDDPIEEELEFGFTEYSELRVLSAITYLKSTVTKKINICGYCLGGMLILNKAIAEHVDRIILLATPWDISKLSYLSYFDIEYLFPDNKIISGNCLELLFYFVNIHKTHQKFNNMVKLEPDSTEFRLFLAVQSWLRDNINVTKKIMTQLYDLYKNGNFITEISQIIAPCLTVIPKFDDIVPYESSVILSKLLLNNKIITANTGHIGMIIGSKAQEELYDEILNFLN